jgi:NAD(P)-dependent dehydrogenase (short-subunit alcohol dehydrogenase family)
VGQLDGRIAVVAGGGRGIGRAVARRFAEEGARVVVSSRTQGDLDAVVGSVEAAGSEGLAVVADAMDRASAREPVVRAIERYGRVDIVVNNVGGTVGRHDAYGGGDDSFESTLVLNLTSAWWTTNAALGAMRENGHGRVINIGSGASERAGGSLAYVTAKHGLVGFTRQLAQTVGEHGITVNCLCPGWTNTSLVDWDAIGRARGVSPGEARAEASRESAQNRILEPEELTGIAALLASDEGRGMRRRGR